MTYPRMENQIKEKTETSMETGLSGGTGAYTQKF